MSLTVRMVLRKLKNRKMSVLLSSFIVAWAMAMMIAGIWSAQVMEVSSADYLDDNGMPDLFVTLSEGASAEYVEPSLSSFSSNQLRLRWNGRASIEGLNTTVVIIGVPESGTDLNQLTLLNGALYSAPGECVLVAGSRTAEDMDVFVNDTLMHLQVTGTVSSPEFLTNELSVGSIVPGSGGMTIVYLPLSSLQAVLGPVVNDILLDMPDGMPRAEAEALLSSLPVSSVTFREDHQTVVLFRMGADKFSTMLPAISLVFVLIGLISIFMTMYRLVLGDSRSIGVLMSIGVGRSSIAVAYLAFGAVVLLIGSIMGVLLGYAFTAGVSQMALDMMGGIPVVLPLDPVPTLAALAFTALAVLTATAIPVGIVLRKSVNEALSYAPRARVRVFKRKGTSLAVSLGLRNLFREPMRAAVVLLAVALSIGTAGSWVLMVDSAMTYLDDQMEAQQWDVGVTFNAPLDRAGAIENLTRANVTQVLPYVSLVGSLSSEGGTAGAAMLASPEITKVRAFNFEEGHFQPGGAILATKLAEELDVRSGDVVTFSLGGKEVDLMVSGTINDMRSNAVYTDNTKVMDLVGEGKCQGAFVIMDDPSAAGAFAVSISDDPLVSAVELGQEQASDLRSLFEGSVSMLYGFFALNLLIALAMAVLATVISTSERDMEFAAMASLGVPKVFIWRSLAIEVGTQASIAALLSAPFAFLLAKQFTLLMEEAVFFIPIVLSISALASVVMLGWLFIWPSVLWPIRWVKRLDAARTLRDRSGR